MEMTQHKKNQIYLYGPTFAEKTAAVCQGKRTKNPILQSRDSTAFPLT